MKILLLIALAFAGGFLTGEASVPVSRLELRPGAVLKNVTLINLPVHFAKVESE